jgi:hypothetical protein
MYIFCVTSHPGMTADWGDVDQVPIDALPDDVLLDVFDFYLNRHWVWRGAWQDLVHVCRRWRAVVFQSPRRLNLEICCTGRTPVREMLDIWPALPLDISGIHYPTYGIQGIIAALEHRDRIRSIYLEHSPWKTVLPVMQEPFPALTSLDLASPGRVAPDICIPDSFLGGSAPRLRHFYLEGLPFPTLPKLLLSATDLVTLKLRAVPHSGYFSPQAMATVLSALASLKSFELRFQSIQSRPDRKSRHPPSSTHAVLSALTKFCFEGVSEYLEDLVALIDVAPLIDRLEIYFFNEPSFHTPHLLHFISRVPKFQALNEAHIFHDNININVPSPTLILPGDTVITIGPIKTPMASEDLDWEPLSLAQLCISSLPLSLTLEHLYLTYPPLHWRDIGDTELLELLRPFTAVKNLYLSKNYAPCIAPALQELVGEGVAEVLPALQKLFLAEKPSGHVQQAIEQFIHARQLSAGHPIAICQWAQEGGKGNSWRQLNDGPSSDSPLLSSFIS